MVEVEDSGSGIATNLLTRIFDPFVTTKQRGSGLGLSICRGIADAHRATIYAMNSAGSNGAIIVIEFPALTQKIAEAANGVLLRDAERSSPVQPRN
jgi:signal transduction histidine kinase